MWQSKYLAETNEVYGGIQRIYHFPNGYGASVIRHNGSYGSAQGLWELAVLDSDTNEITYNTSISNDVIGYLNDEQVILKLNEIRGLQTS